MTQMFPGVDGQSPFIKARVCGDYELLYNLCVKLKRNVEKLKIARALNQDAGELEETQPRVQKRVRSGLKCMCCSATVDAEDHYKEKVVRLKKEINTEFRI